MGGHLQPMTRRVQSLPDARRHIYHFVNFARLAPTVYIDTEVEMTRVIHRRRQYQAAGLRISYISFLIKTIAEVVARHPEANAVVRPGFIPKIAYYEQITAKFTIDKQMNGERIVLSGLIPQADKQSIEQIQQIIEYYRQHEIDELSELANIRKLQKLPTWIGHLGYRLAMRKLANRPATQGTFTISSLGHRPIQSFHPLTSSTLCFGVGAIEHKPAVFQERLEIRPFMKLSLVFDHRALDGALAADILGEIKQELEAATTESNATSIIQEEEVSEDGASTEEGSV